MNAAFIVTVIKGASHISGFYSGYIYFGNDYQ
jgi:hypothetical protein